jgi:multiple sugar transport system substrate-binding protein
MNINRLTRSLALSTATFALVAGVAPAAFAAEECVGQVPQVRMIAQPQPAMTHLDTVKGEFEAKWQTTVEIVMLGENERRARSRLDASTGAGSYQVYYIDEANVAEFASAGWVLPLLDHYPEEYDFDDFLAARLAVAQFEGQPYFAPFMGGGDLMFYRADILEEAGLEPPTTLDEMIAVVEALHNPPEVYGWSARGRRGSGMNVWRWTPFFMAEGGEWFEDTTPVFNSDAAVRATETYLQLMQFAPPGVGTFTWSEVVEGFRAGQVALIVESDVFGPWMEDEAASEIVGRVGYAPPPEPLPSAGFAHGLAIASDGNPDDCSKLVSADFVGWATSKEMEESRMQAGLFSDFGRTSTLQHPLFVENVNPDYIQALLDTEPKTDLWIWAEPEWPEVGDQLGLVLEEIFTGSRPDIQSALDEAADYAEEFVRRSRR